MHQFYERNNILSYSAHFSTPSARFHHSRFSGLLNPSMPVLNPQETRARSLRRLSVSTKALGLNAHEEFKDIDPVGATDISSGADNELPPEEGGSHRGVFDIATEMITQSHVNEFEFEKSVVIQTKASVTRRSCSRNIPNNNLRNVVKYKQKSNSVELHDDHPLPEDCVSFQPVSDTFRNLQDVENLPPTPSIPLAQTSRNMKNNNKNASSYHYTTDQRKRPSKLSPVISERQLINVHCLVDSAAVAVAQCTPTLNGVSRSRVSRPTDRLSSPKTINTGHPFLHLWEQHLERPGECSFSSRAWRTRRADYLSLQNKSTTTDHFDSYDKTLSANTSSSDLTENTSSIQAVTENYEDSHRLSGKRLSIRKRPVNPLPYALSSDVARSIKVERKDSPKSLRASWEPSVLGFRWSDCGGGPVPSKDAPPLCDVMLMWS